MARDLIQLLVIEDNPADVLFLRDRLTRDTLSEFRLTVVEELSAGLDYVQQAHFDVVLLDLGLPDSQGLATFKRIWTQAPHVPILVMSALSDEELAIQAVALGAQDYLVKEASGWIACARAIRYALGRHHAQAALRESERRFSAIFHSNPIGIILSRAADGGVVDVNEALLKLFGYTRDEVIGHTTTELHMFAWPDDRTRLFELLHQQGRLQDIEVQFCNRAGEVGDLLLSAELLELEGEQYLLSMVSDITARKRAEELIRATNTKLTRAQRIAHIGSWEDYLPTGELHWSEEMYHILGFSPNTPINLTQAISVFPPDELARFQSAVHAAIHDHAPYSMDYRIVRPDGTTACIHDEGEIVYDEQGQAVWMHGTTQDITERKRVEEALAQTSHTLAEAQKIAHLGSFEYIAATQLTVWSEEEYHIYGLDPAGPSPAYDVMLQQHIHPDDTALLNQTFTKALQSGSVYELEHRIVRPDGSVGWVYDRANPYFDEQGELVRYIGTTLDITERKQVQEQLTESERFASATLNSLSAHICVIDTTGTILFVNNAWRGYADANPPSPVNYGIGSNYLAVCDSAIGPNSEGSHEFVQGIRAVINGERDTYSLEYPCHSPTEKRWFVEQVTRFPGHGTGRLVISHEDITERRQAEERIRASQAQLLKFASQVPGMLYQFELKPDGAFCVPFATDAIHTLFGCSPEEVREDFAPMARAIYSEDRDQCVRLITQSAENLKPYYDEFRIMLPGQPLRWVQANSSPEKLPNGSIVWSGFITDITERKLAEETLREREQELQTIFDLLPAGISVVSHNRQVVAHNAALQDILGLSRDELQRGDYSARRYLRDDGTEFAYQELPGARAMRARERVHDVTVGVVKEDGTTVWTSVNAAPLPDGGAIVLTTNISERRRAQAELRLLNVELEQRVGKRTAQLQEANERLTELDHLKTKFVSDVTHELRTPITSLSLYIDLLEHGKPDKRDFYVTKLNEQMARLRKLLEDILDMSRLERDMGEGGRAPIDLNSIVEHVCAMESGSAEAAGLTLTCTVDKLAPVVIGRPDQLTRAITNLISNAIKYTLRGSIDVRTCTHAQQVWIEITDTGRGIPADELPHLFSRFYRSREVAQSNIPGTGLGLAIVKEIIEAHGGTVEVESQSGVGSTFRIQLPLAA